MLSTTMKRILILLLLLSLNVQAQPIQLSGEARISVITCGPWQGELYSAFGHSAFRVYDPAHRMDDAYNYGLFDFDQPNFYLNFARGYLYYKLGGQRYPDFQNYYIYFNRYVHEQELDLTQEQKQKLFDYLQWNALPENENYRYDYFYNNCATKIRDVVATVFGDSVKFDGSYVTTEYTIRDLTDIYLIHQPWGDLGIDICLGLPMDKKASPYEYMFLPDYIESGFDHATLKESGTTRPIVKTKNIVYESRDQKIPGGLPHPAYVFGALMILSIGLSIVDWRRKRLSIWFDGLLFLTTGLIGCLLFFLWFATDHAAAANNFNVLWALPTNLVAAIAFIWQPKWLKKYFLVVAIISLLTLTLWPMLPQKLNYSLIPLVIALGIRAFLQATLRQEKRSTPLLD
jgi:hypothetical protein